MGYNEASFGLMDYHARYYSPWLGRFVSPDSVIADPLDSNSYNRYAYVNNNPINHTDPTGHCGIDTAEPLNAECFKLQNSLENLYDITITGQWLLTELTSFSMGLSDLATGLGGSSYFRAAYGGFNSVHPPGLTNQRKCQRCSYIERLRDFLE